MVKRQKKLDILYAVCILLVSGALIGWFTSEEYWQDVTISFMNNANVMATGEDQAPEANTLKLPVTVRADFSAGDTYDIPVEKAQLQYRTSGTTSWTTISPAEYEDIAINWKSGPEQRMMGQYHITESMVGTGAEVLVRLYIANLEQGYENADKSVDTTAEGTNGWEDPWVTSFTTDSNKRPSLEANNLDR